MRIRVRHIIVLIVFASFGAIGYGFWVQEEDPALGSKCIGFGTVGLFLIAMPLFLIKESKGKKMKDYMLTDENIKKMRSERRKKSENQ